MSVHRLGMSSISLGQPQEFLGQGSSHIDLMYKYIDCIRVLLNPGNIRSFLFKTLSLLISLSLVSTPPFSPCETLAATQGQEEKGATFKPPKTLAPRIYQCLPFVAPTPRLDASFSLLVGDFIKGIFRSEKESFRSDRKKILGEEEILSIRSIRLVGGSPCMSNDPN